MQMWTNFHLMKKSKTIKIKWIRKKFANIAERKMLNKAVRNSEIIRRTKLVKIAFVNEKMFSRRCKNSRKCMNWSKLIARWDEINDKKMFINLYFSFALKLVQKFCSTWLSFDQLYQVTLVFINFVQVLLNFVQILLSFVQVLINLIKLRKF